jgi:peptide/nickel transport system substrate-binding protein
VQESSLSPVLPFAPHGIPVVEHDESKAEQLLDSAGWKVGADGVRTKNGRRLSLQFPYFTGSSTADQFVEVIRQQLKAVGIELEARKYAPAIFFAPYQDHGIVYSGKWDMTVFVWQDLPDANLSSLYECNQFPPNGQNALHYCNHRLDRLLEEEKRTYDARAQARLVDREMRLIVADVPTIVLFIFDEGYSRASSVRGFHPGAVTPLGQMNNVTIGP